MSFFETTVRSPPLFAARVARWAAWLTCVPASPLLLTCLQPQGRILNLFSRDIYVLDEVLVRTFFQFFRTLASVGGVIFIVGMGAP